MEKPHDPILCFCPCGDPARECSCPCADCGQRRQAAARLDRIGQLVARIEKSGIPIADFADMILHLIEPTLEARIERVTRDELRIALKRIQLRAEVIGSSLKD